MKHIPITPLCTGIILVTVWGCTDLGEEPQEPKEEKRESIEMLPARDNTLYEDDGGSLSNGIGEHIFAGKTITGPARRAVIAFDIARSLPAEATVDSVILTLNMSRTQVGDELVELHRVLSDWGEGTSDALFNEGGGTQSTPGDATWIHTFFDTTFWTSAGGDYSATISATETVGDIGVYTWGSTPEMVADVQSWLDVPSQAYGWILVGNETERTAKRFDSRENSVESNRPVLKVYYMVSTD